MQNNHRNFLKSNLISGLGAAATRMSIPKASASTSNPSASMGSTHAWLVGQVEPWLKCVIGSCYIPTYGANKEEHLLHCFPNFVPGWKKCVDTPEIAARIALRALHLNLGEKDNGSQIESATCGVHWISESIRRPVCRIISLFLWSRIQGMC